MTLRAVVFDCDGVLADTERDGHRVAFNETFREFGLPVEWDVEEYGSLLRIGGGKERMATLFDGVLAGSAWDGDAATRAGWLTAWHAAKTARYVGLIESGRIPARPGARRLIGEALDRGIRVGVASTSAEPAVRAVLAAVAGSDLAGRVSVSAGDVVARKKPAPDVYLSALEALGVDAHDAVAIEDSGIGCRSAVAAGLTTVITRSSYTADDEFPGAALVLDDLGDPAAAGSHALTIDDLLRLVA